MADGLHAVISGDSSGYEAALKNAATATEKFTGSVNNSTAASKSLYQNITKLSSTTGGFSGVLRNSYTQSQKLATSVTSASTAVAGLSQGFAVASRNTATATTGISSAGHVAQQAGYQIQDMAVQLQMGTSAFVAIGQQAPQFLSIFGPGGAIIGAVVAVGAALSGVLITALSDSGDAMDSLELDTKSLINEFYELSAAQRAYTALQMKKEMAALSATTEKLEEKSKGLRSTLQRTLTADYRNEVEEELAAVNAQMEIAAALIAKYKAAIDGTSGPVSKMIKSLKEEAATAGEGARAKAIYEAKVKNATAAELDEINALYDVIEAKEKAAKADNSLSKVYATRTNQIDSYIQRLRDEQAQLGMSESEKSVYLAQTKGATAAQLEEVRALSVKIEAYKAEENAIKDLEKIKDEVNQKEMQRLAARASILGASGSEDPQAEIAAEQAKNDLKIAMLQEYLNQEIITQTEFNALKEAEEQRHMDALRGIRSAGMNTLEGIITTAYGKQAGLIAGALDDTLSATSAYSKKAFEAHKIMSLGVAIVSGYEAATTAWARGMSAGGPPVAAAFTAASVAKTAAQIQAIRSQSYGSSSGGSSSTSGTTSGATTSAEAQENRVANVTLVGDTFSRSSVEGLMEQLKEASDMGYKVNFG